MTIRDHAYQAAREDLKSTRERIAKKERHGEYDKELEDLHRLMLEDYRLLVRFTPILR